MIYLFTDASKDLFQYLSERRDQVFLNEEKIIREPIRDSDELLLFLRQEKIITIGNRPDSAIMLVFTREPSRDVLSEFFPFMGWIYLPCLRGLVTKYNIERVEASSTLKKALWEEIKIEIAKARNNINGLLAVFTPQKHPLLLAFDCFDQSGELKTLAFELFCEGFRTPSIVNYSEDAVRRFNRIYRPEKRHRPRWYMNGNDVIFKHAKSTELHGKDWEGSLGHTSNCHLCNHWRFGIPIDPLFHFDIQHENSKINRLTCTLMSCHEEITDHKSVTHVNVWRNEFNS